MEEKNKKDINRRDFIKIVGISAATSTAILYGCSSKGTSSSSSASAEGEIPTDKMTYRTSPTTGDRVSLLGYGCMRWPLKPAPDGKGEVIDQDAVNGLIDYAIAHGVNYFDTSPAYVQGFSEKSTGIALSRYPRDKYFIATKLSNFSPDTWSREASLKMYHKSFADLQVDYIDYMLLHGIGMGGMDALKGRYLDNGMLDFLIKEREAGRIRNLGFSYHGDIEVYDYLLSRHDEIKWDFVQIQLNYVDWKHAKETNARNTDAEYLYGELHKRGIPSIIMEPLLGGRLSKLNDNLVARLKQRCPESSVASWAFRFAGTFPDILTELPRSPSPARSCPGAPCSSTSRPCSCSRASRPRAAPSCSAWGHARPSSPSPKASRGHSRLPCLHHRATQRRVARQVQARLASSLRRHG